MRSIIFLVSAAMFVCNGAPGNAAIYIDNFSTIQILTSSSGFVSGPGILGTERDTEAYAPTVNINSAIPGQLRVFNAHPEGYWGTAWLTYDGVDHNTSFSNMNGLGNVDLTEGGLNDRLRIPVTAANNAGGSFTITLRNAGFVGSSITIPIPSSPTILDLLFADFQIAPFAAAQPINFADVGHVELSFSMFLGDSCTIDSIFATVPEPSSAAMVVIVGVAVACATRKRSAP